MEHKKKIWLKGILAVALFVMVFITYLSPVFAAINNSYNSDTGVTQANLKKSIENDNPLVAPIASFVYFIGSVVEWLLGSMTGMVTGMNTMPWADMILYNAVPMLDVNFLNPDPNSMINHLNDVIRKIYFTIFSLALSFFGIAVIVMAIKLAISSIAEEKAKYKSAITNWLMAVVLLFTMHYFMAFIFYLNESIVEMASNITTTALEKKNFSVNGGNAYNNFKASLKSKYSGSALEEVEEHLNNNENFYVDFLNNLDENLQKYITKDRDISDDWSAWEDLDGTILLFGQLCCETSKSDDMKDYIYGKENEEGLKQLYENYMKDTTNTSAKKLLLDKWQMDGGFGLKVIPNNSTHNKFEDILKYGITAAFAGGIVTIGASFWSMINDMRDEGAYESAKENVNMIGQYLYYVDLGSNNPSKSSNVITAPISKLANFFKYSSYNVGENSIKAKNVNPVFCFLYTIFVFQSLLYFFSYIKRFFYIIVLAIMAPIVVVYDFVSKM